MKTRALVPGVDKLAESSDKEGVLLDWAVTEAVMALPAGGLRKIVNWVLSKAAGRDITKEEGLDSRMIGSMD